MAGGRGPPWPKSSSPATAPAIQAVRTLFAVGDEKQSIFSFQGAVAAWVPPACSRNGDRLARPGPPSYSWADLELHLYVPLGAGGSCPPSTRSSRRRRPTIAATHGSSHRVSRHVARRRGDVGRVGHLAGAGRRRTKSRRRRTGATPLDLILGEGSPEVQTGQAHCGNDFRAVWASHAVLRCAGQGRQRAEADPATGGIFILLPRSRGDAYRYKDQQRAEDQRRADRRRRPADPHRAHRGHGPPERSPPRRADAG